MLQGITYYCWVDVNAVKAKTINKEGQLQALVDGKKIIIIESTIRRDLQLEDAEGVNCLPNAVIFEQLALMGTMASVIICLSINQKFNFSKYIFESMVKNLDNVNKFLMYLRFVQVFLNNQLEEMSYHNRIYVTPSHIKKIFGNTKRVGKGFSGRDTPLFPTMMIQAQKDLGEDSANLTDPHHPPTIIQPSTSQPQNTKHYRKHRRKVTEVPQPSDPISVVDEAVNEEIDDSLERATTTATSLDAECQETIGDSAAQTRSERVSKISNGPLLVGVNIPRSVEDSLKLTKLMKLCTKLQQRVLDLETTKTTQAMEIESFTHDEQMFDVDQDLGGEEVFVAQQDEKVIEKEVDAVQIQVSTAATILQSQLMKLLWLKNELVEKSSKKAEEEVIKGSSDRAGTELEQESVKKQKIDDDKETVKLKQLVNIIPDEEGVAINAIPLILTKKMWKLVKSKYGSTRPEEDYERVLWGDLKVMF
nr:hypothetical protein [Tanacetum cinerariifolium]